MGRPVQEVMQKDVVTVTPDTPVRELLRRLVGAQISGVPVVTGEGEIVGVVSATDVVRLAAQESEIPDRSITWEPLSLPAEEYDEESAAPFFLAPDDLRYPTDVEAESFPEGVFGGSAVSDIMTPAVFTVEPSDTVENVAKFMLQGRIHRVLVVEEGQLKGIVTSFDMLRAFVEGD
jgi:CBS domain-containing protein